MDSGRAWRPRYLIYLAHLWLGLTSGLVVFIVGATGALYVFEPELKRAYTREHRQVAPGGPAVPLPPSRLAEIGDRALDREVAALGPPDGRWLLVGSAEGAAVYSAFWDERAAWYEVYIDARRGDVLGVHDQQWDPLNVVLRLHRSLLLPESVGRWIVAIAVLISVLMLLSGLFLWFPRRPRTLTRPGALRQRLTISWRHRFGRLNYDLHRVLGFYSFAAALVIALTGLVWSFDWMNRAVYWAATGGGTFVEPPPVRSGPPTPIPDGRARPADRALAAVMADAPSAARYEVIFPTRGDGAIQVCANPDAAGFYRVDCHWFDRYSGEPRRVDRYRDKDRGEMLRAMNYDIHVGQILDLPGRLLACAASLVVASLPLTGTLMWWRRGRTPGPFRAPPVISPEPSPSRGEKER
jgi:uncharacterized iron-regulated membrane protein